MNDLFWLRDGVLAGSAGPNRVVWNLQDLVTHNIGKVLSVNDGEMVRKEELEAFSIDYKRVPLSSNAPPVNGDMEFCLDVLPEALAYVLSPGRAPEATLVHCSSGKDRTGLFLCYYLCIVEKYTPEAAIAAVKKVRPIALTARGWNEFAYAVLRQAVA